MVNRTSAIFPWEMAAIRVDDELSFFGPDFQLTRQFRSLLSESPGVPPPLNDQLEVLVIADPGDDGLALPGAERGPRGRPRTHPGAEGVGRPPQPQSHLAARGPTKSDQGAAREPDPRKGPRHPGSIHQRSRHLRPAGNPGFVDGKPIRRCPLRRARSLRPRVRSRGLGVQ